MSIGFSQENKKSKEKVQSDSRTYSDDFYYSEGTGTAHKNSFNNWYWEMFPRSFYTPSRETYDSYLTFEFNDTLSEGCKTSCVHLKIKKNAPTTEYQDAEIFNNACISSVCPQDPQPKYQWYPCNSVFPNTELLIKPPYPMISSCAKPGAMYSPNYHDRGIADSVHNTPYFATFTEAYSIKTRVKATGKTYGTRGWGLWNTKWSQSKKNPLSGYDRFAWFYEFGVRNPKTNSCVTLPTVITADGHGNFCISYLKGVDIYKWHDYKVILFKDTVEYYIDNMLIAQHKVAPHADSSGGMSYHNWVDNRLFSIDPLFKDTIIPIDKENILDNFYAAPLPNQKPSKITPKFSNLFCGLVEKEKSLAEILKKLLAVHEEYLNSIIGKTN
jgi:hypothetical protein